MHWSARVTRGPYEIADYRCAVVGGELRAGDDAADARWVDAAALADLPLVDELLAVLDRLGRATALLSAGQLVGSGRPGCSPPRLSPYERLGTMTFRRNVHTTVPSCLYPRVSTCTTPRSSLDRDGVLSSTSVSP